MTRKYISLLLVGLFLVHLAGFYVYFVVRMGDIRMEMRKKIALLPAEQLEVLRIPATSFQSSWLEDREMEWQGRMYDIGRVEKGAEEILVYGLHDKDEDGLLNFIGAVVDMARQDTKPTPTPVIQFFSLKFLAHQSFTLFCAVPSKQSNFIPAFFLPSAVFLDGLTPPPRV
jgi:hypothetical protein